MVNSYIYLPAVKNFWPWRADIVIKVYTVTVVSSGSVSLDMCVRPRNWKGRVFTNWTTSGQICWIDRSKSILSFSGPSTPTFLAHQHRHFWSINTNISGPLTQIFLTHQHKHFWSINTNISDPSTQTFLAHQHKHFWPINANVSGPSTQNFLTRQHKLSWSINTNFSGPRYKKIISGPSSQMESILRVSGNRPPSSRSSVASTLLICQASRRL